MAIVDEPDVRGVSPEIAEWIYAITEIINGGLLNLKYYGSPPTSSTRASEREVGFSKDGSTWYVYIYTNSTDGWRKIQMTTL